VELVQQAIDIFLHLDQHLNEWAIALGPWLYLLLFTIIFCETGLVALPFLPGDSLLFAVGALASTDGSPISVPVVMVLLIVAAVTGDALNYAIGAYLGPKVFTRASTRFFKQEHLLRTQEFYVRHGAKTIFLARFVPIVRTFAPFVAGVGSMPYATFALWNISGATTWIVSLVLAGYFFGQIPWVKENFETVVLAIVAISVLPIVIEWLRSRRPRSAGA